MDLAQMIKCAILSKKSEMMEVKGDQIVKDIKASVFDECLEIVDNISKMQEGKEE